MPSSICLSNERGAACAVLSSGLFPANHQGRLVVSRNLTYLDQCFPHGSVEQDITRYTTKIRDRQLTTFR